MLLPYMGALLSPQYNATQFSIYMTAFTDIYYMPGKVLGFRYKDNSALKVKSPSTAIKTEFKSCL